MTLSPPLLGCACPFAEEIGSIADAEGATRPRNLSGTRDRENGAPLESGQRKLAHRRGKFGGRPGRRVNLSGPRTEEALDGWFTPAAGTSLAESVPARKTPLHALHERLGGKIAPFAGWAMPLQYPTGILSEHHHTRTKVSLFDVSHMGSVEITGTDAAVRLETLIPADLSGLVAGQIRYAVLTNDEGGVIDDLLVTRTENGLSLVVNASRIEVDMAWLNERLPGADVRLLENRAVMALQGPEAETVLARHAPQAANLLAHEATPMEIAHTACVTSRCGYTGEDGFEIACSAEDGKRLAETLLTEPEVEPAGLGARDSLRLEAGLCLWGNDLDETTSPVEAGLSWTFGSWRENGQPVPGVARIRDELANGPARRRVGLLLDGRAIARKGAPVLAPNGNRVGTTTSGGFAPSLNAAIAMAYLEPSLVDPGTELEIEIRGRTARARVVPLPFVPHRRRRTASKNGDIK